MGPITKEQSDQLDHTMQIANYAIVAFVVWLCTRNTGAVILGVLVHTWIAGLLIIFGVPDAIRRWVDRTLPS